MNRSNGMCWMFAILTKRAAADFRTASGRLNPVYIGAACVAAFGLWLLNPARGDEAAQVERAYRLTYGRLPTREEFARASQFLSEQRHRREPTRAAAQTAMDPRLAALADFCHALFNSSEFLYME